MPRPRNIAAILIMSLCASAQAQENAAAPAPVLRSEAAVASEIVRIGDLVAHAGAAADIAIFRAPDLGQTGAVAAARVLEAARKHGLSVDAGGLAEVTVTRLARSIGVKEIEERIAAAVGGQRAIGGADKFRISFDREVRALQVEPTVGELRVKRASFDPHSSRFDVSFEIPGSAAAARLRLRYTGALVETEEVAVLARPIGRGDVIRAGDVAIERRPKAAAPAGALADLDRIIGLAARRALSPGQAVRAADLMKPELVRQNELVTVTYEAPGLTLSIRGKALESGAHGDLINVLNIQSKRTMQGAVTGPGRISIAGPAPVVLTEPAPARSVAAGAPPHRTE